jgi:pimeloyl-ACP methyl ester carboxylesterase
MKEMLEKSGEVGPFVLVGHSFGGYNVRVFTSRYPDLVSGLVLVDAMHEDQEPDFWAAQNISEAEGLKMNEKTDEGVFRLKEIVPSGIWRLIVGFPFVSPQLNEAEQKLQKQMTSQNTWADAIYSEGDTFIYATIIFRGKCANNFCGKCPGNSWERIWEPSACCAYCRTKHKWNMRSSVN